jgi:hypothetical protein
MKIQKRWAIPIAAVVGSGFYTQITYGRIFPISIKPIAEPVTRLIEIGYAQWQDKGPTVEFSPSNIGSELKSRVFPQGDSESNEEDIQTPIVYGETDKGCEKVFEGEIFVDLGKFQHHINFFENPTVDTLKTAGLNPFCESEKGLIYVDATDTTKRQEVKVEEGGRVIRE